MKMYLVTGCAGFIGSNLCEQLLKDGNEVIGVDILSTGTQENLDILKKSAGTKEFDLLLKNNSFKQFLEAFKSDKIDVFYKEGLKTEIVWALGDHGAIDAASKIADSLINPGYRFGAYKTLVKNVYKKFPKELVN